ncbi:MAG: hypothetical protein ABIA63_02890 [bacterium]
MKKIILPLLLIILFFGCSENPQVTFSNQTGLWVYVSFGGEEIKIRTGSERTAELEAPGDYTFSSTAGVKEVDESCGGMLNLKENSKVRVSYYLADISDSTEIKFKLWAAITDKHKGSPLSATSSGGEE